MKPFLAALTVLIFGITAGNLNNINASTNVIQTQNLKKQVVIKQQIKTDISLINLNKKGKFYFFNNKVGLVISEDQLWFLDKDHHFEAIANPNHIKFTEFISGQGGNYGILTDKNTGDLYFLNINGDLQLLKLKVLFVESKIHGKTTIISNSKFLIETKMFGRNVLFLGEVKNKLLLPLKYLAWFETIKEIQAIRDDECIIKADDGDYSLLINNDNYNLNKLSWTGKYYFKNNREVWVIKNDNQQLLIYNYVTNTHQELKLAGTDIFRLNGNCYLLKQDDTYITIINASGQIIKAKYQFAIAPNFNLLNINNQLLLLAEPQQTTTIRIIQRNLNAKNELVVLKTINLDNEYAAIKLLNHQEDKKSSNSVFFLKFLNDSNCIFHINVDKQNMKKLSINFENIPNQMHGEINRYNKTASIFTEDETNDLYWYQVF